MTIYLLHGYNVRDGGANTTDNLVVPLRAAGHQVVELDYGWWGRLKVRLASKSLAMVIAKMAEPGSIIIGHSNGGTLAYRAARLGAEVERIILINPALNHAAPLPLPRVDCYHSPNDRVVELARWIPGSLWGNAGRVGLQGAINHNLEHITGQKIGHSDALKSPKFSAHLVRLLA